MDRISDSGSDGLGSNPDGSTKNAFIGIYRPYRGKNTGKVLQKTLPVLILWCSKSLAVARETYDREIHNFPMRTRKTHFFGIRKQSRTRQVDIVLG